MAFDPDAYLASKTKQPAAPQGAQQSPSAAGRAADFASGVNRFFTTILPGMPADTAANVMDLMKAGAGVAYHELSGEPIPQALELGDRSKLPLTSANIQKNIDEYAPVIGRAIRPYNQDAIGRGLLNVGIGVAGAATGNAMSGSVATPEIVKNMLLSVTPSTAQSIAAEAYPDSATIPLLANIGAGIVQSGVRYGAPELTKRALRGGEEGRVAAQKTINTFEQVGATPSVGQATGNRGYQATESMLSRVPGGAGQMIKKGESVSQSLATKVNDMADSLAPTANPESVGRAIYKGVTGEHAKNPQDSFIPKARAIQGQLYAKLDDHIDTNAQIPATNTAAALNNLVAKIPGAENISESGLINNPALKSLSSAVNADMGRGKGSYVNDPRGPISYNPVSVSGSPSSGVGTMGTSAVERHAQNQSTVTAGGRKYVPAGGVGDQATSSFTPPSQTLPYQAIKEMRSRIGEKLSEVDLAPDAPKAQLKQLYAALSADMEQAAKDAGPQAYRAFKRANGYTKAMHDRIDMLQSVVDKNGGPEKIYSAATSGTREGATVLRAVMKSLPDDGRRMLSSALLRRMGRAMPGQQNDVGDVFSTERFLTQWNTMSPQAKQAAFSQYGKTFTSDMDALASVAANLRSGSKVFANPSGTAQAISQQTAAVTILGALATGHPEAAAVATGGVISANLAARALTSPRVVHWMAKTTKLPTSQLENQIRILALTGDRNNDQDAIDLAKALKGANKQSKNTN